MAEESAKPEQDVEPGEAESGTTSRFPELEDLQREIDRRIRDNRRFLEKFLDDDFAEEGEEGDADGEEEFEEL